MSISLVIEVAFDKDKNENKILIELLESSCWYERPGIIRIGDMMDGARVEFMMVGG